MNTRTNNIRDNEVGRVIIGASVGGGGGIFPPRVCGFKEGMTLHHPRLFFLYRYTVGVVCTQFI